MADPFGTGAGIIGVLSLALQITKVVVQLGLDWKDAPEAVKAFIAELRTLRTVLSELHTNILLNPDFAEAFQLRPSVLLSQLGPDASSTSDTKNMLEICHKELESLLMELSQRSQGHRLSWERLKGAFLANHTRESIQILSRQCKSLDSILWIDVAALGATIHKEVREGRREQQEWHQADNKITLAIRDSLDRGNEQQEHREREQNRQVILDWITPITYSSDQSDFLSYRQEGTGQWLLGCVEFQQWLHTDRSTLFCPGIPGVGKTIMTAVVINDLATRFTENSTIGMAYIFCNFRRQGEQRPKDLLESLLRQLAESQACLPESLFSLYKKHKARRTRPLLDEIFTTLRSVVAAFSKTFIIIDAMDECQVSNGHRSRFLSQIFGLQSVTGAKLFATFRKDVGIEEDFKGHLCCEIRASDGDVLKYLNGQLPLLPKCVSSRPELKEEIKGVITMAAGGIFLLAELYLRELEQLRVPKAIRTALSQFKIEAQDSSENKKFKVLLKVYDRAMDRIIKQGNDSGVLAKKVLSWITHATRPLTVLELRYAIAAEYGELELDEDNLPAIEDIVSVCAGLVTVDKESNIVRLVHYTAQEYFDRTQRRWFPTADSDIAMICISYLSISAFEGEICPKADDFEKSLQSNQFFEYVAQSWGHHARKGGSNPELDTSVLQFLESTVKVAAAGEAMLTHGNHPGHRRKAPRGIQGLHLTAYFGLRNVAFELLKKGYDQGVKDADGCTPLMWAVDYGQEELVGMLLAKGSGTGTCDTLRRTALHHAASIGQITSIHHLIQHQADVEARDLQGQTPLLVAISKGQKAAVELLLRAGAEVTAFDGERKGALHLSIESEFFGIEMVELLLAHGAPFDITDVNNMTPLHCTIQFNRRDIASVLLNDGVAVDLRVQRRSWIPRLIRGSTVYEPNIADTAQRVVTDDLRGLTPLHFAALVGDTGMTEFFLGHGADPNALSHYGETPLHLALSRSIQGSKYRDSWNESRWRLESLWDVVEFHDEDVHDEVATQITTTRRDLVEILLRDDRTNVTFQDAQGLSVLHTVNYTELDSPHIIRSLIQKGARVAACNLKRQTALHLASLAGHLDTVKVLLSHGSVIEMADNEGRTALHYAAKSRSPQTVISIIEAYQGEIPDFLNIRDNFGRNALHHSVGDSCSVQFDMVRTLLNLGANANNTDDDGNSPLAHYLSPFRFFIDLTICQLLLSHGTRAKSVNKAGKTLAESYAMFGEVDVEVLELLKDYDVDIDKVDSKGMNLLHTIALGGSLTEEALIYLLRISHIRQETTDYFGKTALQYATEEADRERHPFLFDSKRWSRTADILRMHAT